MGHPFTGHKGRGGGCFTGSTELLLRRVLIVGVLAAIAVHRPLRLEKER